MNVALVILYNDPSHSGAERYTHDLAVALTKQGHGVTLPCQGSAGDIAGTTVVELGHPTDTRFGRLTPFVEAVEQHLRQNHYRDERGQARMALT